MRKILDKLCVVCGKKFYKPVWISLKNWNETRKYCSRECQSQFWRGKEGRRKGKGLGYIPWNKGKQLHYTVWNKGEKGSEYAKIHGYGLWMKGKKLSEETKRKIGEAQQGEKSASWKGDKVSYGGLHRWVYKTLGQSDTCEYCGLTDLKGRNIHWANKDHKYRRNVKDWIRLCRKCHLIYDKKFKK